MLHHLEIAYIYESSSPRQRLFSAWYTVFFIRSWKLLLKDAALHRDQHKDAFNATSVKNFISSNLAACIEIDGHSILIFHNKCRDMGRPDLFLPWLLNSQHCESTFRSWRSLSTIRSTIVNMDIMEVTNRSTRLQVMEEAPTTISDFFSKTEKRTDQFIADVLLTDNEIKGIVLDGSESVGKVLSKFSMYFKMFL